MSGKHRHIILLVLGSVLLTCALVALDASRPRYAVLPEPNNTRLAAAARRIAAEFVSVWAKVNGLKVGDIQCEPPERRFEQWEIGWYWAFDFFSLDCFVRVAEGDGTVVRFFGGQDLTPRGWYDLKDHEARLEEVKKWVKIPKEDAEKRARNFVAKVYPRFEARDFQAVVSQIEVCPTSACYAIEWREVFDPKNPTAFPNSIKVRVNPATGVITDYDARNVAFPKGFKLVFMAEEAEKKAEAAMKEYLDNAHRPLPCNDIRLWDKRPAELHCLVSRQRLSRRFCWFVAYKYQATEPSGSKGPLYFFNPVYDASNGEPVPQEFLEFPLVGQLGI